MVSHSSSESSRRGKSSGGSSLLGLQVAVIFLLLALLVQAASTAYYYRLEKRHLTAQLEQTKTAVEDSEKARKQLEGLAGKTATLAEEGNRGAIAIIQQFKKAGIALKNPEP